MSKIFDQRGETLIEIMITVLVVSIGLVALTGAMGSSVIASDAHRGMAVGEVLVRSYGEAIKVQAAKNLDTGITRGTNAYKACPQSELAPVGFATPTGWNAPVITKTEWWIPTSNTYTTVRQTCLNYFETQCGNDPAHTNASDQYISACDAGLQRITYNITNTRTDYASTSVGASLVVRRGEAP
jgi:prepilin-type N-terminal cleavage/methylation domain-containing protein